MPSAMAMTEKADLTGGMEKGEMKDGEEEEAPHAAAGHGGHGVSVCVCGVCV